MPGEMWISQIIMDTEKGSYGFGDLEIFKRSHFGFDIYP